VLEIHRNQSIFSSGFSGLPSQSLGITFTTIFNTQNFMHTQEEGKSSTRLIKTKWLMNNKNDFTFEQQPFPAREKKKSSPIIKLLVFLGRRARVTRSALGIYCLIFSTHTHTQIYGHLSVILCGFICVAILLFRVTQILVPSEINKLNYHRESCIMAKYPPIQIYLSLSC
jgi:hypothetical protein